MTWPQLAYLVLQHLGIGVAAVATAMAAGTLPDPYTKQGLTMFLIAVFAGGANHLRKPPADDTPAT